MGCSVSVCAGRDTGRKAAIERERDACVFFMTINSYLTCDLRSFYLKNDRTPCTYVVGCYRMSD